MQLHEKPYRLLSVNQGLRSEIGGQRTTILTSEDEASALSVSPFSSISVGYPPVAPHTQRGMLWWKVACAHERASAA